MVFISGSRVTSGSRVISFSGSRVLGSSGSWVFGLLGSWALKFWGTLLHFKIKAKENNKKIEKKQKIVFFIFIFLRLLYMAWVTREYPKYPNFGSGRVGSGPFHGQVLQVQNSE